MVGALFLELGTPGVEEVTGVGQGLGDVVVVLVDRVDEGSPAGGLDETVRVEDAGGLVVTAGVGLDRPTPNGFLENADLFFETGDLGLVLPDLFLCLADLGGELLVVGRGAQGALHRGFDQASRCGDIRELLELGLLFGREAGLFVGRRLCLGLGLGVGPEGGGARRDDSSAEHEREKCRGGAPRGDCTKK